MTKVELPLGKARRVLFSRHGIFHIAHSASGAAVFVPSFLGALSFGSLALLTGLWLIPLSGDFLYHTIMRPTRKLRIAYAVLFGESVVAIIVLLYVTTLNRP